MSEKLGPGAVGSVGEVVRGSFASRSDLHQVPAARQPSGTQINAALDALLAHLPPSQAKRLKQELNATVLSDDDACWAGQTFFANVAALDVPYRSTLLLALVQNK